MRRENKGIPPTGGCEPQETKVEVWRALEGGAPRQTCGKDRIFRQVSQQMKRSSIL